MGISLFSLFEKTCPNDNESFSMINSCSNVRAVISIDANDEIRDMATNYNIPRDKNIRSSLGIKLGTSWDNFTNGSTLYPISYTVTGMSRADQIYYTYWTGSTTSGALSNHCSNFSTSSGAGASIGSSLYNDTSMVGSTTNTNCDQLFKLLCICF